MLIAMPLEEIRQQTRAGRPVKVVQIIGAATDIVGGVQWFSLCKSESGDEKFKENENSTEMRN
jgi:hypothetical protein